MPYGINWSLQEKDYCQAHKGILHWYLRLTKEKIKIIFIVDQWYRIIDI